MTLTGLWPRRQRTVQILSMLQGLSWTPSDRAIPPRGTVPSQTLLLQGYPPRANFNGSAPGMRTRSECQTVLKRSHFGYGTPWSKGLCPNELAHSWRPKNPRKFFFLLGEPLGYEPRTLVRFNAWPPVTHGFPRPRPGVIKPRVEARHNC